jgi:hypothetical protein
LKCYINAPRNVAWNRKGVLKREQVRLHLLWRQAVLLLLQHRPPVPGQART